MEPLHRRKLSNANGLSFSAKQHPYDGVLTGAQSKFGAPVLPSGAPDYSEIFGGSRDSSIPVLDLSGIDDAAVSDDGRSSDKLDYSNIFGGFSREDMAVRNEELFSRGKRGKRSSAKSRTASEGSDQCSPSGRQKESSCDAANQSLDGPKHFNLSYHKTSQRSRDGLNGMTQIAELHAVPGFTHFIDESSHVPKTESCQQAPFVKSDVLRQRSFSGEIFKGRDRKGDLHVPKIQSSDGVHRNRSFSGEIFKEGHARNRDLHVPKLQTSDVHRNRSFSGEIFKEGHAENEDLHVPRNQSSDGHHNRHFSGEIVREGPDRSGDLHIPKKLSSDVHHDTSFSGELFNGHDRKENLHVPKKLSPIGVVKVKSGSSWDVFNDKFFSARDEFDKRSSSTEGASASNPVANDIKGQPYQSKITGPDFKFGESGRGSRVNDTSPPSSDEELDANSAAAISAATLKKAIEKAQESIRLAKELMERKSEGVPASLKRRSKGSLKSKDNRVECNTRSNRGDTIELQGKIGIGLPPFTEVCREIPSSNAVLASCFNLKEQQRVTGNVEVSHRDVAGTWSPEVVSSRKENTQTLASQQVDSSNHSQPSMENNSHVYKPKEMNPSNKTKELDEAPDYTKSMGDIKPTPNILGKSEAPEEYKDTSNSALMHDSEEYVNSELTKDYCFAKEKANCSAESKKSENMKNNLESTFVEQWSFKNLQNSLALLTEEKIEFQEMENDNLHNNQKTPLENETLNHEDLECRIASKQLEKVEMEENKSRLRRSSDEEETGIVDKEASLWVENDEKPQHGFKKEGIDNKHEDFQGGQDAGISYGVHECEPSESKTTYSCEGEESERNLEGSEREVPQNISIEPCQYEATEEIENRADKFTQNRKTEASQKVDEIDSKLVEASDKSEGDQEISVSPSVADKQNSMKTIYEPDHDGSTCSSEIQEACEYQLENGDLGISQQAVDFEGIQGVSEAINEHAECEKYGASEESSNYREREIMETASDLQNASEGDTSEGMVQDTYDSSSEDAKEVSRGSTCMNTADNLPSERVLFEKESFCNVIPENVSDNESHFVPEVHPSEEQRNTTFIDRNLEQKRDETGKEPEESSDPDEGDDSWVPEHVENEETIKVDGSVVDQVEKNNDIEAAQQVKKSVENSEGLEWSSLLGDREPLGNDEELKSELYEEEKNLSEKIVVEEDTKESLTKEVDKNNGRKTEVDMRQQREREKDRKVVERAIREARERAFADVCERAERAAVERVTAEVRQRVMAEAREKREKASASIKVSTDKSSIEAKRKAERAAVERATAEARERALEKALSQKNIAELRSQVDRDDVERSASRTRENKLKQSLSSSDLEKFDGSNSESAQRRKARLERHQRIMERAAKALEEKNQRDLLAQKEQMERTRLAEALDSDIKRWASGKEGNLRALLSTLQYILGTSSGWQPISLTEIITTAAVKKAYRKATLYVHPDKLQQRGASIQQKYICEKVFDLLKAAWNRFNSEER
ncbi:hypothetical protein MTR67_021032 [Solanum verrucosum]|uniref:J domain-containing protein n=1 Tax=Solanum verrucosum TaxID=315347 RepID=A0AAF0QRT7_SOLVR|nr:auxilin-like protein 1 [Solanum verrucosum]WMV27647.1 hypothetical protein MTR67_021032 [Solanum verrucosum]